MEIIGLYASRTGLTGYSVPPVLGKKLIPVAFSFFLYRLGTKVPGILTTLHRTDTWYILGIAHWLDFHNADANTVTKHG